MLKRNLIGILAALSLIPVSAIADGSDGNRSGG